MPQDELTVIVEYDPVTVQIDEADPPLNVTLISNMGPPGPPGDTGPAGADSTVPGPTGPAGATGPPGSAGAAGQDGTDGATWYSGSGAPIGSVGVIGDWYFQTTTGNVYLKTGSTTWTFEINLIGPAGADGADGPPGADGADGSPGADGADGSPGADGINGSTWYSGSGAPSGGTGINGDYYFRTSTGDVYHKSAGAWGSPIANLIGPTGADGPPGADGATGATGPPGADGSAANIAADTHAATSKATPVDADELPLDDSAASFALKKLTWANLKATLKTYFDTLYPSGSGTSTGTNTGDQTAVSGNAGTATTLQTSRNIDGQAFNGSADITVIAPGTHAATGKTTPVDADELSLVDSAASNVLKKLTWANLKATLKTYFDTLYAPIGGGGGGDVAGDTHAAASKTTPVDADELALVDSAASNVLKKLTWANLKATLKTYFDTLYPSGSGTSTGTNTGDQTSVSGNAGTATVLATSRNIDGQAFNGSADITVIAPGTHAATGKTTPIDADELSLVDSAASNVLKKLTWANLKATLKTYFDTLYNLYDWAVTTHAATGKTTPVDADELSIVDSAASNVIKKLTWANLKATLKTYLDTLYKPKGNTVQVDAHLNAPDASGNGYAALVAPTNFRQLLPAFVKDVDGDWWGVVRVPQDYASGGAIILRLGANSTAGQVTSFIVSSKVLDTSATWDTALTDETVQDITMSTTAYRPTDATFTLTTTPVAGKDLLFKVRHNGTRGADTLAVDTLLFQTIFQYVAS